MRKYIEDKKELVEVICNKCEKKLLVENGILKEGNFEGNQVFGYFSSQDGIKHHFDLCEHCYSKIIQGFAIPVEEKEMMEYF